MPNEQIIDGILHFESHGEMVPYCQQALTKMLVDARKHDPMQYVKVFHPGDALGTYRIAQTAHQK